MARGRPKKEKKDIKDIDDVFAAIEKKYGKNVLMHLDEEYKIGGIDVISTGSLDLNFALGIGGVPKGRIIEIYGPESSGKTSLTYSIIKKLQQSGGKAAFIDAEHAFDYDYAKTVGINIPKLLISQPDYGEQALDIVQMLVESEKLDLIVVDSVAALTPKAEIEGEMEDAQIGLQARLMSKAMRKLSGVISKTNTCVIFINQIRMKIGVMFGNPETTTGGRALRFYTSMRIDLRRTKTLKNGENPVGTIIRAKVAKNKVAPPFKVAEFEIYFDEGLSETSSVLTMAVKHNIIKKAGAWYSYKDENIGQGTDQTRHFLKDNPDILKEITTQVLGLLGKKQSVSNEKTAEKDSE